MGYRCKLCGGIDNLLFICRDCNENYCRKHHPFDKHKCVNKNNKSHRYISVTESKKCYI